MIENSLTLGFIKFYIKDCRCVAQKQSQKRQREAQKWVKHLIITFVKEREEWLGSESRTNSFLSSDDYQHFWKFS